MEPGSVSGTPPSNPPDEAPEGNDFGEEPRLSIGGKSLTVEEAHKAVRGSAGWFYWVAGLSLLNSLLALFGAEGFNTIEVHFSSPRVPALERPTPLSRAAASSEAPDYHGTPPSSGIAPGSGSLPFGTPHRGASA